LPERKYAWLAEAIADNGIVVTASRRLSRELRVAFDEQQQANGKTAWLAPPIWSWQDWLSQQLTAIADAKRVPTHLDSFSETLLWEQCLKKQLPEVLPGFAGAVRQAKQSWHRLQDWMIPVAELGTTARSYDERMYAQAAAEYQRRLRAGSWLDRGGKAAVLADLIEQRQLAVPERVFLAGFDRISPAIRRVCAAIDNAGGTTTVALAPRHDSQMSIVCFDRLESELRTAGAWAREQLAANPHASVAIVSPILEANAAQIARLVREGLVPGWQYGGARYESAANVSYGRKLSEYPAVATALLILRWANQGLTGRELSLLLRSRSLASNETNGRSRIELALRRFPDRSWMAEEFCDVFGKTGTGIDSGTDIGTDTKVFLECAAEIAKVAKLRHDSASPARWAQRFDSILAAVHWPGPAVLNSKEFQLVNRWRELLNEFARIETIVPALNLAEAIRRLSALAADTLYQPESGSGLVHILGTLEAAGMEFDCIWISGLDASQWPPVARPAAFVATALQKKHDMPDATPGDTLAFAQSVLQRLAASAETCVLSWSMTRDDAELTASSLLETFTESSSVAATDPGWYAGQLVGAALSNADADDDAPPVAGDDRVRGGAYTVQRQVTEPFGAFVYGRLGVKPPEPIETGLSAGTRGNIIHNALHNLLATRPTQQEISAWSLENREQRIGSAVDAALAEHLVHADAVLRRIIALERNRLRKLLQDFLTAEIARESFALVDVERQVDYSAFGVRIGLRIDRIDRLDDGRLLLIDYKTGQVKNFLDRNGEPADVQLIVYADALADDIGGLALINVDSRTIVYKGAGAGSPRNKQDMDIWPEILRGWQAQVHNAMKNIAAGDVRMNVLLSAKDSRPLNILSRKEEQKRVD